MHPLIPAERHVGQDERRVVKAPVREDEQARRTGARISHDHRNRSRGKLVGRDAEPHGRSVSTGQ
jgi:hypothetical protein